MIFRSLRNQLAFFQFHLLHMRGTSAIQRWQARRLARLIPYVSAHIPVYNNLLAMAQVTPGSIRTLADIRRLPITTKALFLDKPVREYTNRSRALRGYWARTSGSSGTPFTPLRREHVRLPWYGDSLHYRFMNWERPWMLRMQWARIGHIRVLTAARKNHLVVPVKDFLNDTAHAVQKLVDFKPDIIETHASLLYELATFVKEQGIPLRPQYAVSVSENLSDAARTAIQDGLQCPVYNRYGLEEFGTVGVECTAHDGFHINCETFIVEILDTHGQPCPEGTYGRVVVTDLYNWEMPFVRYDTGDWGKISWRQCVCGLYAPRIWIEGRYGASFTLNGKKYHHFEFDAALDSFMNVIVSYQVVKLSEERICVRIVPGPAYTTDSVSQILAHLQERIGPHVAITVERVQGIARVPQGKSQILKDESQPQQETTSTTVAR